MSGYQARRVSFVLRSERAGTNSLLDEVRAAVWSVNASLPLAHVHTLNEVYDRSMARTTFVLVLLAVAATMALVLGVSGLYGVIAYAVSQRWREIGIRMAVGAQPHEIRRLFLRWGLAARRLRRGGRDRCGHRSDPADAVAALRDQPARSDHVHRRLHPAHGGCRSGRLSAEPKRGIRGSCQDSQRQLTGASPCSKRRSLTNCPAGRLPF